ncbi:FadR/GntR family transcriptional regulator [Dermatophilus congolensis]|nr:GntR family transcriptional regulator [Dermatophilus congolensis]
MCSFLWEDASMCAALPQVVGANLNPAARAIFDWILASDLVQGDPLPVEQELAEQFTMARGTVREAIRELRALGIVEVRRDLGTYVGAASIDAIRPSLVFRSLKSPTGGDSCRDLAGMRELVEVRALLECSLVAEVTGTLSPQTGQRLMELASRMDGTSSHAEDDRSFHQLLYSGVSNALATELIDVFWDAFHCAQDRIPSTPAVSATSQQHLLIAQCVMGDDPNASRQAMWHHFDDIRSRLALAHRAAR